MLDFSEAKLKEEQLLQLAVQYVITGVYSAGIIKDKKITVYRKVGTLVDIDKGEALLQCYWKKVKLAVEKKEQAQILHACHAELTSSQFNLAIQEYGDE